MLPPFTTLLAFSDALVDLVLPRQCAGCNRPGAALCSTCGCPALQASTLDGLPVVAATRYEDAMRSALLAYKERGRRDLARPLGALLAQAVAALPGAGAGTGEPAVVVPVPSAPAARRARGGDHVLRLARAAAPRSHLAPAALRLVRSVRDSAGLDTAARAANLHGAMLAGPPVRSGRAVIVDDIVTTGATVLEAARALGAAGWSVQAAAVVAATPRRHPQATPANLLAGSPGRSFPAGLP